MRYLYLFLIFSMPLVATPLQEKLVQEDTFDAKELDRLIETLESTEGRTKFLNKLKTLRSATKPKEKEEDKNSSLVFHTRFFLDSFQSMKHEVLYEGQKTFQTLCSFIKDIQLSSLYVFLKNFGILCLALVIGRGGEYLFSRLFFKVKKQMVLSVNKGFMRLIYFILLKILSLFMGLCLFIILASIVVIVFQREPQISYAMMMIILMIAGGKGLLALAKIILNPKKPLMGVGSKMNPDFLMGIFVFIKKTIIILTTAALVLYGIHFSDKLYTLTPLIETTVFAILTALIFRFMSFIQDHQKHHTKRDTWPGLIKGYVVIQTSVIILFGHESFIEFLIKGTQTLVILTVISVMIDKFPHYLKSFLIRMQAYSPTLEKRQKIYIKLGRMCFWAFMLIGLMACLKYIWDDAFWDTLWHYYKQNFSSMFLGVFALILTGILLWEGSDFLLDHYFKSKYQRNPNSKNLKRYETLMPLIRNTLRVVIIIFIGLMIISEMGFNITPILAGASVIGIALSLGAQSLVKDFINGCFIVIENTIALGDYVEAGGHTGTVKMLTLRSLTLRDSLGGIHTLPFSTITTVVNLSKNYFKCKFLLKFDREIAYETVCTLLHKAGDKLKETEAHHNDIRGHLEIKGIQEFDDQSYTLEAYLTLSPGKQWEIENAFLTLLSEIFLENKLKLFTLKQFMTYETAASLPSSAK